MAELGVPILWYGLQIALRVAIGWYLAQAPAVIDAFAAKH
jgi:prolipoprotein diacylglyceryltransferase